MILVYITCKDESEAEKISKHLLEKKLVACTNISPIRSFFSWEGEIKDEKEYTIIGKTTSNKFDEIKNEIKKIHSYDIPCVLKIDAEANSGFDDWVKKEVK